MVVVRRRKKRRDVEYPASSALNVAADRNQSILLVQEEIERIKSKTKTNVDNGDVSEQGAVLTAAKNYHLNKNSEPSSTAGPSSRLPSSLQKRVSFILTNGTSEEAKLPSTTNEPSSTAASTDPTSEAYDMAKRLLKTRQLSSSGLSKTSSLQAKVFNDSGSKPVLLANYKPPQKLDSLTSSTEIFQTATAKIETQPLLAKRSSARSRGNGASTPTTTPNTTTVSTPTAQSLNMHVNRLELLKANQAQLAKSYQNTATSTIEPLARYSASNLNKLNRQISISANDIGPGSSKQLRLPPVNNSGNSGGVSASGSGVVLGGSVNNLTAIGLNEGMAKKKIKDMRNYCYFCKRKTGLASSYTCR